MRRDGRAPEVGHAGELTVGQLAQALSRRPLEHAIGVIYRPETERTSHYFLACLPRQFDCVLHFDQTRAVEPLEWGNIWKLGGAPETFPGGL
jgi:erythromycin esterase-like protein